MADGDGTEGGSWIEQASGRFFIYGRIDGQDFIIDGPWDDRDGAQKYLDRLLRWKSAPVIGER